MCIYIYIYIYTYYYRITVILDNHIIILYNSNTIYSNHYVISYYNIAHGQEVALQPIVRPGVLSMRICVYIYIYIYIYIYTHINIHVHIYIYIYIFFHQLYFRQRAERDHRGTGAKISPSGKSEAQM